ncbi:MAG TPA: carboxypeptidase-like regulatory domain-containing protein, partial [Bacteroidales bacterium]|nr:carboxypeptidase-like regulatory domain-containing protein [Bacteroidales bacterium]
QYYPGYYTNTENYQANLTFRVTQRINLGINLHRDFQNAALDTLVYAAPRTERVQAFLGLTLPSGILLNLRAGRREQEDRLEPRLFHYAEDFLHLTLSRNGARWGLDVQGEVSETRNLLMGPAQASSGFMLHGNLSYRPSGWLNLSMFLAHSGNTRYSADLASYWYYGGSARMDIRKRTRFFITARNSFETSEYYRDRSYLESGLIQAVGRHHEVVLSGQYGSRQGVLDKPTWSYRIGYALKLGVPLKRTTEANASITGTISPGSSSINPQGLVLHLNGYTAVTDAQGRYAFYNMKAGDYFLVIDRESMPVNAVPSIPQAYPVSVAPGEERILDFRLQAGGAIHGQLRMNGKGNGETHTPEENRAFTEQHFVIVEVSGPQGSQRTITSKDGHFRFFPLYPGEY